MMKPESFPLAIKERVTASFPGYAGGSEDHRALEFLHLTTCGCSLEQYKSL